MTLDGAAWMAIFTIFGAFLCVSAFIFETAQPDPITEKRERRDMAHQFHPSAEGIAARSRTPRRGQVSAVPSAQERELLTGTAGE